MKHKPFTFVYPHLGVPLNTNTNMQAHLHPHFRAYLEVPSTTHIKSLETLWIILLWINFVLPFILIIIFILLVTTG